MDEAKVITIVDDDSSVRKALDRLIKAAGYKAIAYDSAEAFLTASESDQTDCLILDVQLPGISGLELQANLAKEGSKCPIVFISAFSDQYARDEAIHAGAACFLPKPLDTDQLIRCIEKMIFAE